MSGPDLPNPTPGSGGLGVDFTIGVSPFGTIAPFNIWATIISQYANSPILDAMIEAFNDATDQTENLDDFYDMMWNVDTAGSQDPAGIVDYGLDVWGRIVGVTRILQIQSGTYFGFAEAANPETVGFNQGYPFFTGTALTNNYVLTNHDFRTLILAKAYANICGNSVQEINQLLLTLFAGFGDSYVTDNHNMTMTYTLSWTPTLTQLAVIENSGVLPRLNGVQVLYNIP